MKPQMNTEQQSRNQKTSACELIGGKVWSSAFRLQCARAG